MTKFFKPAANTILLFFKGQEDPSSPLPYPIVTSSAATTITIHSLPPLCFICFASNMSLLKTTKTRRNQRWNRTPTTSKVFLGIDTHMLLVTMCRGCIKQLKESRYWKEQHAIWFYSMRLHLYHAFIPAWPSMTLQPTNYHHASIPRDVVRFRAVWPCYEWQIWRFRN